MGKLSKSSQLQGLSVHPASMTVVFFFRPYLQLRKFSQLNLMGVAGFHQVHLR